MKKIFTLFVLAIVCCLNAAAQVVPEDGKQYVIKNVPTGYYIVLATGSDSKGDANNTTAASLGAVGTAFTFTGTTDNFTLQAEDGKWFGMAPKNSNNQTWNVATDASANWTVSGSAETGYYILRPGTSTGLGLDGSDVGAGIYTDKTDSKRTTWVFEEYVAPEVTHDVVLVVDDQDEVKMLEDGEGGYYANVTVEAGEHTATVTYDGEPTEKSFATAPFSDADGGPYSSGLVTVTYKDGVITVTGKPVDAMTSITTVTAAKQGRIYDLQGRRVARQNGVTIENGVKVLR